MNIISKLLEEFKKNRSSLEMSRNQMKDILSNFKSILLYGAGSSGIAFLHDLRKIDINPVYFVDSNKRKIGNSYEGIEIISPDAILGKVKGEFLIIVCINTDGKRYCKSFDEALRIGGHHGVYDRLHSVGCQNVIDYTYFRRCFSLFTEEKYNAPSCSDIDLMVENEDKIVSIYEMLDDDLSRETYEKIIRFRLLDDSIDVPTLSQETQYFERDLYHPRKDAVFIDCGAYNGISAKTFFSLQRGTFEKYYGFEPDPMNFKKLKFFMRETSADIQGKMIISDKGLWNVSDRLLLFALDGPGSFVANDIGRTEIKTTTIDDVLKGTKATFIKMNIEGSEKQALQGAEKTIRKYKPELAVAGYHRTDDLWKIPLLMRTYHDNYKISLRSYMNHISFVYYAR